MVTMTMWHGRACPKQPVRLPVRIRTTLALFLMRAGRRAEAEAETG